MVRPTFSIDEQIEAVVLWICYSELVSNHRTCSNKMPHSENSNNKRRGIHPKPYRNPSSYEANDIKQQEPVSLL